MQLLTVFLLIGCLSITTADKEAVNQMHKYILWFLDYQKKNPIDSDEHELTLLNECLGSTSKTLIWKARFDDKEVAVKFFTAKHIRNQESAVYEALNAIDNPEIEKKGIPNVYYVGKMFNTCPIIVMTLFDGSLFSRWEAQGMHFNMYSTLQVFLQSVRVLKYLRSRGVVHNDIKPENIFLRGSEVFIGDFDLSTSNDEHSVSGTNKFASSGWWSGQNRTAMDDLESLVYTIWFIENINSDQPDGSIVSNKNAIEKEAFVLEKCEHFADFLRAYEACVFICKDEMFSGKLVPDYKKIIQHLKAAIKQVMKETEQTEFEWLTSPESVPSSLSASIRSKKK